MKYIWLLLSAAVMTAGFADDGKFLTYFEKVEDADAKSAFGVIVTAVIPHSAAERAGVKRGDFVVGMNGLRLYGRNDMFVIDQASPELNLKTLDVADGGRIKEKRITDLVSPKRGEFRFGERGISNGEAVRMLRINAEEIFRTTFGLPADRPIRSHEHEWLYNVPDRFSHDILAAAKPDAEQSRQWASGFLMAFFQMSLQRYDDALKTIDSKRLQETAPSPFLKDLMLFYKRVATRPPTPESFPLKAYNADPTFIAVCYPYPVQFSDSAEDVFKGMPEFRKLYLMRYGGTPSEMLTAAAKGKQFSGSDQLPGYVDRIKKCLLVNTQDIAEGRVWSCNVAKDLTNQLEKRLTALPDEQLLTAFALLQPAMYSGSFEAFEKAYGIIAKEGSRELELADELVRQAIVHWLPQPKNLGSVYEIQERLRPKESIPALYRFLAKHNGLAHFCTQTGVMWSYRNDLSARSRMIGHLSLQPEAVSILYGSLAHPIAMENLDEDIKQALRANDPTQIQRVTMRLCERMGVKRTPDKDNRLLCQLLERISPDSINHVMIELIRAHRRVRCNLFDIKRPYDIIWKRTLKTINPASQKVNALQADDPDLQAKCEQILKDAGFPLVKLILSDHLNRIGKTDLAAPLVTECRWYYSLLSGVYTSIGQIKIRDRLATEVMNAPGNKYGRFHLARWLRRTKQTSSQVFNAENRYQQGDWNTAINKLQEAMQHAPKGPGWSFFWNGKMYKANSKDFAVDMGKSWLSNTEMPQQARQRLQSILGVQVDDQNDVDQKETNDQMSQCHELFAVPAKRPIQADGDLSEWDLSGSRLLCKDLSKYKDKYSAKVALAYNEDDLYIALQVVDDSPLTNKAHWESDGNPHWNGDGVQLRLLVKEKGYNLDFWYCAPAGLKMMEVQSSGRSDTVLIPPGAEKKDDIYGRRPPCRWIHGSTDRPGNAEPIRHEHRGSDSCGLKLAFKKTANGYIQEIGIDWKYLGVEAGKPNDLFQMLIQINWGKPFREHCFPGNVRKGVKTHDEIWRTPADYGLVVLSPRGDLKLDDPEFMKELIGGKLLVTRKLATHKAKVNNVCFIPGNGYRMATAGRDGIACIWDIHADKVTAKLKHDASVDALAVSSDGSRLATACNSDVILWDTKSGKQLRVFKGHSKQISDLAFVPQTKLLASGSLDKSIRFWDTETGKEKVKWMFKRGIKSMAVSSDGTLIAIGCLNRIVYVCNTKTGKKVTECNGHTFAVRDLAFSPDNKRIASASDDMTTLVWDASTGKDIGAPFTHASLVTGVVFKGEDTVFTACQDGAVRAWKVAGNAKPEILRSSDQGLWSMALSADGSLLSFSDSSFQVELLAP